MSRHKPSSKDKYEHQKELAKERQRRRRARLSVEELEKKREYDRHRYKELKDQNKIKGIRDMTPREARKQRKIWRKANQKRREKENAKKQLLENTPPPSPLTTENESQQKKRGRKMVKKCKAKAYRTIKKQDEKIENLEKRLEKYKKKLYREKQKVKVCDPTSPSPMKQVKEVVGTDNVSPRVKKQLFLGYVLQKQIKSQMKGVKFSKKKNQSFRKVIGNKVLKKYRVQKHFQGILPYRANIVVKDKDPFKYTRRPKLGLSKTDEKKLINFFECDTVSKMCPGKKDFVTRGKLKKQRRILLDTMGNLYKRFIDEHKVNISLRSFYRTRPYWVTFPRKSDRDTCACIKHANMGMMLTALNRNKVVKEHNLDEIVASTVCSYKNEDCMLCKCEFCKRKEVNFNYQENFKIKYFKWMKVKEQKTIKGKSKTVQKTVKVKKVVTVSKMIQEFKKELVTYKEHSFRARHQSKELKKKIENLKEEEILFRIDFSENYVCKYSNEVQSVHFGASKKQITLNTGIMYCKRDGKVKEQCFCTACDNLDHQAHAVWAHMEPILKNASRKYPNTTTVHFFSDSPSSQYRNRNNVFLMKSVMPRYFKKLKHMTWNYTEAGHGKGPMDGVGGTMKREADRNVLHGVDIVSAADFVRVLENTSITLLEIDPKSVLTFKKEISLVEVPAIDGIMKVYQITYASGILRARSLSCFECSPSIFCGHYDLFEVYPDEELSDLDSDFESSSFQVINQKRLSVDDVYSTTDDEDHNDFDIQPSVNPSTSRMSDDHGLSQNLPVQESASTTSPVDVIDELSLQDRLKISKCSMLKKCDTTYSSIDSGSFVLVTFKNKVKKCKDQTFVGICQDKLVNNECNVMFLKRCEKDSSLFKVDEKDVSLVHCKQIVKVLSQPVITLKGNRIFYKFKEELLSKVN